MTRVFNVPALVLLASLVATAGCDFQHKESLATAPTSLPTGTTPTTAAAYLGTWASLNLQASNEPACGNFEWNITNQTPTSMSGDFSAMCLGSIKLTGSATGQIDGQSLNMNVGGSANLGGIACNFTLNGTGTLEQELIRITYNATTCIGPFSGSETLHRGQIPGLPPPPAPDPPPAPTPDPTPEPEPQPSADQIDLNQVTFVLGPTNVGSWRQTSTVTNVRAEPHFLCVYHTMLGHWPSTIFFDDPNTLVEGNQWVFANINGRWYAGAGEWYRPGQACKDVTADNIARDAFYYPEQEPLRSWVPKPGELFGMMVTTPARAYPLMRTWDERSNVVLVRWGG